MPDMKKAAELDAAIRASPALVAHRRIEAVAHALYVFRRNYEELKGALDRATDPGSILPIHDISRRAELDVVLMEIRRLLHNYLAAAKTLIDQTRVIIADGYEGQPFFARYKQEIDRRFATDPTASIVQGLRNYLLHYGLPATFSKITLSRDPHGDGTTVEAKITLKRESLLRWDKWPPPAREMLENSAEDIDLEDIAQTYAKFIFEFHDWLTAELGAIHAADLAWLEDMSKRLRDAAGTP